MINSTAAIILLISMSDSSCGPVKMENRSKLPWVKHDFETVEVCKKRCGQIDSEFPCLRTFIKIGYQNYYCGCSEV